MVKPFRRMQARLVELAQGVEEGLLSACFLNDPDFFELEKEPIFSCSWVFLAPTPEIPKPGDYVFRHILNPSHIVVRGGRVKGQPLSNLLLFGR